MVACGDPIPSNYFPRIFCYFLSACSFFLSFKKLGFSVAVMKVCFSTYVRLECPMCGRLLVNTRMFYKTKNRVAVVWRHTKVKAGIPCVFSRKRFRTIMPQVVEGVEVQDPKAGC